MSSLVLELQQAASDDRISVPDLLRKALIVAAKLKLAEFRQWVENELNGYRGKMQPEYRKVPGRPVVHNPFHGYQPMVLPDEGLMELLSNMPLNSPIGELQDLVSSNPDAPFFLLSYPPRAQETLIQFQGQFPMMPSLQIPRGAIVAILDAVRNTVLTWSLKLEEDGIVGENMTFSPKEKVIASEKEHELQPSITIINNNIPGGMKNSAVQQASPHSQQRLSDRNS